MSRKLRNAICRASLALSVVLSTAAFGQAAAAASSSTGTSSPAVIPGKVGIINIQDAIVATNDGKKEFEALDTRFSPKRNELKALNDNVEAQKKDLEAKGATLNDDERAKRVKKLETDQKTLQRNYEDAQNEYQQAEQEVVNRIGKVMLNVLEKYAKDNGYAVILDVSNPQTPVLWANQGTVITKDLVDAYNAQSPTAAPAAGAPAAKPTANRAPAGGTTGAKKP